MMRRVAGTVIGVLLYAAAVGGVVWGFVTDSFPWVMVPLGVAAVAAGLLIWKPATGREWGVVVLTVIGVGTTVAAWVMSRDLDGPRTTVVHLWGGPRTVPAAVWAGLWLVATVLFLIALARVARTLFRSSHLVGFPLNHDDEGVRTRALGSVRRQSTLRRIAGDPGVYGDVRMAAAARLQDPAAAQAVYHTMVSSAPVAPYLQLQAVAHLDDQDRLTDIAMHNGKSGDVRLAATERLADPAVAQAAYQDIATGPRTDFASRLTAAARLDDPAGAQAVYEEMARTERDPERAKQLAALLTEESRRRVAEAADTPPATACVMGGHVPDAVCTCGRCGEVVHDWEPNPHFGGRDDLFSTCGHCGATRRMGYRQVDCPGCGGSGWASHKKCPSCGGTSWFMEHYDDITPATGPGVPARAGTHQAVEQGSAATGVETPGTLTTPHQAVEQGSAATGVETPGAGSAMDQTLDTSRDPDVRRDDGEWGSTAGNPPPVIPAKAGTPGTQPEDSTPDPPPVIPAQAGTPGTRPEDSTPDAGPAPGADPTPGGPRTPRIYDLTSVNDVVEFVRANVHPAQHPSDYWSDDPAQRYVTLRTYTGSIENPVGLLDDAGRAAVRDQLTHTIDSFATCWYDAAASAVPPRWVTVRGAPADEPTTTGRLSKNAPAFGVETPGPDPEEGTS